MTQRLLRVQEVAFRLGLEPTTIRAWIHDGKMAAVRVGSRAIRIPASELERIIKAGAIRAEKLQAEPRAGATI